MPASDLARDRHSSACIYRELYPLSPSLERRLSGPMQRHATPDSASAAAASRSPRDPNPPAARAWELARSPLRRRCRSSGSRRRRSLRGRAPPSSADYGVRPSSPAPATAAALRSTRPRCSCRPPRRRSGSATARHPRRPPPSIVVVLLRDRRLDRRGCAPSRAPRFQLERSVRCLEGSVW